MTMSRARLEEIISGPSFRKLTTARAALRWSSSLAVLIVFFGFVGAISMASANFRLGTVEGSLPPGMTAAFAVIAAFVLVTGYYVDRSNRTLDDLAQAVRRECER